MSKKEMKTTLHPDLPESIIEELLAAADDTGGSDAERDTGAADDSEMEGSGTRETEAPAVSQ